MPQTIDIPKVGQVEFPDGMSDDDIAKASHKLYTDQLVTEHTENLQKTQSLEGWKQPIKEGRLTGTLTPPPTLSGELGQGLVGVGRGALNLVKGIGQMGQAVTDPYGTIKGEMERQEEISSRPPSLINDFERVPLLGPAVVGLGRDINKFVTGTTGEAGEVLGRQGIPLLLGAGATRAVKGVRSAARYDPQGAVSDVAQMLRKTGAASNEQIGELAPRLEEAWHEIHHQALKKNKLFNNIGTKEAVDLAKDAKADIWKENVTRHMDKYGNVPTKMSSVPEAMKKGLDPQISEHAAIIKEIDNMAAKDFAKDWPLQRIENRIKSLNAETNSVDFIQKVGQAKAGVKLRMLDALRDVEADRIGAITGEDITAFKNRYGSLVEAEKLLEKAHNINKGTKLSTPQPGKIGRAYKSLKDIDIAHPAGLPEQLLKTVVNKELSPDQLIGRSLKKMGGHSRRAEIAPAGYKAKTPLAPPPAGPEFNQSMEQYLNLNNVSPEAQQFLGVRETPLKRPKYLSEPPKE